MTMFVSGPSRTSRTGITGVRVLITLAGILIAATFLLYPSIHTAAMSPAWPLPRDHMPVGSSREREQSSAERSRADLAAFNKLLTHQRESEFGLFSNTGVFALATNPVTAAESNPDYFAVLAGEVGIRTYILYASKYYDLSDGNATYGRRLKPFIPEIPSHRHFVAGVDEWVCKANQKLISKAGASYVYPHINISSCSSRDSWLRSLQTLRMDGDNAHFHHEYVRMLERWEGVHLQVVPNARVSGVCGNVAHGGTILMPLTCRNDRVYFPYDNLTAPGAVRALHVDEVFVCNHQAEVYHWSVEAVSRLAPFLPFLRRHPDIRLLVPGRGAPLELAASSLERLGIGRERLVSGDVTARVAYVPQGARCLGLASALGAVLASEGYMRYIHAHLEPGDTPQDGIVLIHRTGTRPLVQHEQVREALRAIATHHGLRFAVYSDDALPGYDDTMRLFHGAALVVGAHGAGLVNLMFARPETVVIEIQCRNVQGALCYLSLMRNLGHIYYGMADNRGVSESSHCEDVRVSVAMLEKVVNFYVKNHIIPKMEARLQK